MKVYYSILAHDAGANLIYQGLATSAISASAFLVSKGHGIYPPHIKPLCSGDTWSKRVIVSPHLVEATELLTPELLSRLKFDGIKQAEEKLKTRKEKRKH